MKVIDIGGRLVGDGQPCFIIAEAGVNHNGKLDMALKLVISAAEQKADAVKFQKRSVEDILVASALEKPYLNPNSLGKTYGEHRHRLELNRDQYLEIIKCAKENGVTFLASAWDPRSADFLEELNVPAYKTASADLTNLPLLDHIARTKKPILISTGMSTMDEIAEAVETITKHHDSMVLMHCVSTYPCENHHVNLRVMDKLREKFGCLVGYSGHERGVAIPVSAVARGAAVIEKHFTLDRTLPGPDHAASLEPGGMSRLVRYIRTTEAALGNGEKVFLDEEKPVRERLAKSICTRQHIPSGTVITADMLTMKGPGTGLKANRLQELVGKTARQDLEKDTVVPPAALTW